jgi:muramidase (phage lysozyme)
MTNNMIAFLSMIAQSEGTLSVKGSDNGYNVLVGGTLFSSYADHPRKKVYCKKYNIWSTAAGRYQILERYYDAYRHMLGLSNFKPDSQDRIAMQLISECGAIDLVNHGHIKDAIKRCGSRWASLPNSGYGQHENSADNLLAYYKESGGLLA